MTAERGSKRVAPEKEDHIYSKRVSKNKEKEQISRHLRASKHKKRDQISLVI
jgi:hypothetical protein